MDNETDFPCVIMSHRPILLTRPPRVFDLVDDGDGVSWVPDHGQEDAEFDGDDGPYRLPDEAVSPRGGAPDMSLPLSSYRLTAERRIERRKRPRPRKLDVTA